MGVNPMCEKTLKQAPSGEGKVPASDQTIIYPKEVVDERTRDLSEKVHAIQHLLDTIHKSLDAIKLILTRELPASQAVIYHQGICEIMENIRNYVHQAITLMIENKLPVDKDFKKYELKYGVKFKQHGKIILGAILIDSKGKVKPALVCTNYSNVDYYEGEENE
jgi:hypothetical protein